MHTRASEAISRKHRDPTSKSSSAHSLLCNLHYDVLALIFQAVAARSPCALGEAIKGPNPLDGLSRTNKMMRKLCIPILFENIIIKSERLYPRKHVTEMARKGSTVRRYIKYDDFSYRAGNYLY